MFHKIKQHFYQSILTNHKSPPPPQSLPPHPSPPHPQSILLLLVEDFLD